MCDVGNLCSITLNKQGRVEVNLNISNDVELDSVLLTLVTLQGSIYSMFKDKFGDIVADSYLNAVRQYVSEHLIDYSDLSDLKVC